MSKFKQTESGLIIPVEEEDPTKRPLKNIQIFSITTGYSREICKFITAIEKQGGIVCGALVIDRHNCWGDKMGYNFAVIYQAEEEISIEQWT